MRAEGHAATAMYAQIRRAVADIKLNGIDRADLGAFSTPYAKLAVYLDAPAFALAERGCGANLGAGGGVASDAHISFKTGGKTAGRTYMYARRAP